jgi:hypothetical protein
MKKRPKQKPPVKTSDQSSDSFDDDVVDSLSSSDESETYEPGFLDDPAMVCFCLLHLSVSMLRPF